MPFSISHKYLNVLLHAAFIYCEAFTKFAPLNNQKLLSLSLALFIFQKPKIAMPMLKTCQYKIFNIDFKEATEYRSSNIL